MRFCSFPILFWARILVSCGCFSFHGKVFFECCAFLSSLAFRVSSRVNGLSRNSLGRMTRTSLFRHPSFSPSSHWGEGGVRSILDFWIWILFLVSLRSKPSFSSFPVLLAWATAVFWERGGLRCFGPSRVFSLLLTKSFYSSFSGCLGMGNFLSSFPF